MKRKAMPRKADKRVFRKTVSASKSVNYKHPRGGIRF